VDIESKIADSRVTSGSIAISISPKLDSGNWILVVSTPLWEIKCLKEKNILNRLRKTVIVEIVIMVRYFPITSSILFAALTNMVSSVPLSFSPATRSDATTAPPLNS